MAENRSGAGNNTRAAPKTAATPSRPDTAKMTPAQIAQAIVDGTLRPRVGEVKRIAEALLDKASPAKPAKAPKKDSKKAAVKKDKAKKAGSKKAARKLAKIPGQKKKKK